MSVKKTHGKPAPKPKGGRPKLEIDAGLVEYLASISCTTAEIAAACHCSPDTILGRFSAQVDKGRENGKTRLRKKQIEVALGGNVSMLIWLGKQMLGQSEKVEAKTEHSGTVNGTLSKEDADAVSAWAADIRKHIRASRTKT